MSVPRVGVTSRPLHRRQWLGTFLGAAPQAVRSGIRDRVLRHQARDWVALAGWGNRPSGQRAAQLSATLGLPCWRLEDGFLRSSGDSADRLALSLVVDDLGVYYDCRQPSRLENLIAAGAPADRDVAERCDKLIADWRMHRLSKYNHVRDHAVPMHKPYVLVVDQTAGDCAIDGALADRHRFALMLEAALDTAPDCQILIKTHPDVFAGRKQGCIDALTPGAAARVKVIATPTHAPDVLEHAAQVFVVSSQMGFEALLWERPVRTFGMPFYAGWGLTQDDMSTPARRHPATLNDLVCASLIAYPRYVDPETGQRCEVEAVMAHIALQRHMRSRLPRSIALIGFSRWKRPVARVFFAGSDVHFANAESRRHAHRTKACWGAAAAAVKTKSGSGILPGNTDERYLHGSGSQVWTVEDGFIRSVGLGANGVRPQSWVIDDCGIYYDASRPSRLEHLLQYGRFDPALLVRARALIVRVQQARITKYNVGGKMWRMPPETQTKRTLLVIGQVEGDQSWLLGLSLHASNEAFLRAVRTTYPDHYVLFKPHPDVVAALRRGAVPARIAMQLCDAVVAAYDLASLLQQVDEVHVMTSLTGFEALLRGKRVITHGAPFYAGWGLTIDLALPAAVASRRQRRLSVEALAAAALILYPRYISGITGRFTTPERLLDEMTQMRDAHLRVLRQPRYFAIALQLHQRCAAAWRRLLSALRYINPKC